MRGWSVPVLLANRVHPIEFAHPPDSLFALLGGAILSSSRADRGDLGGGSVGILQNFLIVPLTFLAGVFGLMHSLPEFWLVSHLNPFFYMVDGFRRLPRGERCAARHNLQW